MSAKKVFTPWHKEGLGFSPFEFLQRDINRAFDELWRGFDFAQIGRRAWFTDLGPSVDASESDTELRITVELPGLDESEIEVELGDDSLTIRGEKHEEHEEDDAEERSYHLRERSYGAFERTIPLPSGIDPGKTTAAFENGVLTVTIPKTAAARKAQKVAINPK